MADDDLHLFRVRLHRDVLVTIFDFLQLRGFLPVRENNAVSAEYAVIRPVLPVPAVQQRFLSETVPRHQGLINKVPDKAALVQLLLISQFRILMHRPV